MFLALGVVFMLLSFVSEGSGFLMILYIISYSCAFMSAYLSCFFPLLSLICYLTVRGHICPLCKKIIGIGTCECFTGGERVRTPDRLADMA